MEYRFTKKILINVRLKQVKSSYVKNNRIIPKKTIDVFWYLFV